MARAHFRGPPASEPFCSDLSPLLQAPVPREVRQDKHLLSVPGVRVKREALNPGGRPRGAAEGASGEHVVDTRTGLGKWGQETGHPAPLSQTPCSPTGSSPFALDTLGDSLALVSLPPTPNSLEAFSAVPSFSVTGWPCPLVGRCGTATDRKMVA